MKTVLAISDSVEGTPYDLKRTTKTIKSFQMDPLLVVPAIFERNGNHVVNSSDEILEYVFSSECELSAITIGYMTEQDVLENLASRLRAMGKGRVPVILQPSFFTDDGEILVSEDLYYSICDNLIPCVDLIIINKFEAELLSEMECNDDGDFTNAARDISKQFKCAVLIRHVNGEGGKNLLFNGVSSLWISTPPHLIDGANKNFNLMSAVACSMVEKPLIGSAIRNAIYFCSIDKNKPQEEYEEEELEEFVESISEASEEVSEVVSEEPQMQVIEEIPETIISEDVSVEESVAVNTIEESIVDEPSVETETTINEVEESAPEVVEEPVVIKEEIKPEIPEVKLEVKPEVKPEVKTDFKKTITSGGSTRISAADAIAAAKAQSPLLFGGSMPERKPRVREPLASTPVPKFGSNSILGSKSVIAPPTTAELAKENGSNTTTSSLVSPVKTLRDIARSLDAFKDGEEKPAITSTIEKPVPGPKAPVLDLTPESSAVKLQSLRERLNNMTGSDKN